MRYISLFFRFFRYSLIREFEFRFNFITWSIANIIWAGLILISVDLIMGQAGTVAGWTQDQVRILAVTYTIFGGLIWFFILPSLGNFARFIRDGALDSYLTIPANLRFLVTFNKFEFDQIIRNFIMIAALFILVTRLNPTITPLNWLSGVILLLEGLFLFYNLYFFLITLNFWLTNLFNTEWLVEIFAEFGRYPSDIFKGSLRFVFAYILPVAFIATFPAKAFFGQPVVLELVAGFIVCVLTFVATNYFWNFALKRYSSASS